MFPRILVHSPRDGEARRYAELVRGAYSDAPVTVSTTAEQAERAIEDAEILVGWFFPPAIFAKAARLRWIHKVSAGVEDVVGNPDVPADVVLTRTDGSMIAPRMVEYVLGAIFAIVQGFARAWRQQRERRWQTFPVCLARGQSVMRLMLPSRLSVRNFQA